MVPVASPEAPLGVSPSRSVVGEVPRAPGVLPEPLAGEPFVRGVRASVEEVGHACGVAMEVACADEACSVSVDAPRDGTLASAVWFAERPPLLRQYFGLARAGASGNARLLEERRAAQGVKRE